jgi:hypothetical protein
MHSEPIQEMNYEETDMCRTLMDFKNLLEKYGVERALDEMDEDTFWILFNFFHKPS